MAVIGCVQAMFSAIRPTGLIISKPECSSSTCHLSGERYRAAGVPGEREGWGRVGGGERSQD